MSTTQSHTEDHCLLLGVTILVEIQQV